MRYSKNCEESGTSEGLWDRLGEVKTPENAFSFRHPKLSHNPSLAPVLPLLVEWGIFEVGVSASEFEEYGRI